MPMKRCSALTAAAPRPGTCSGAHAACQTETSMAAAWRQHSRERGLPEAAAGRVGDPREADHVEGVGEQRQVGDRVLDLGALVELRPADHLVGDLAAHERVLEHPRHRVRAVQHRDLRACGALVQESLDLAHDEPRLGVLVVQSPARGPSPPPPARSTAAWRSRRGCSRSRHWRRRGSSRSSDSSARASRPGRRGSRPGSPGCCAPPRRGSCRSTASHRPPPRGCGGRQCSFARRARAPGDPPPTSSWSSRYCA